MGLCAPWAWLAWLIYLEIRQPGSALGADAGETIVHFLGEWALIVLLLSYSITPVRQLLQFPALARSRRMAGLFAFAYVLTHICAYLWLYLEFEFAALYEDVLERPYITVGFLAGVCLLTMALTSTRGWQRRLRRNWQRLHRLVHLAVGLALVHLWWLTKDGYAEVVLFSSWFGLLVVWRLFNARQANPAVQ